MSLAKRWYQIVGDENGSTAIESVALLGVVAFTLILIWRAFQVDYLDAQGNLHQAGKTQVQQAMDQSLDSQLNEYDQKHHSFSPWSAFFWAISMQGTSGDSNSKGSSSGESLSNLSDFQDKVQQVERFSQEMQSFTRDSFDQIQSQQKNLGSCDECSNFTSEQLCASDQPIIDVARKIVFAKNPFCKDCEGEVQEVTQEIKSNSKISCPGK